MTWGQLVTWDGILPVVVAVLPWVAKRYGLRNDLVFFGMVIVAPMSAALIRAVVGYRQFRGLGLNAPPAWRQVVLGSGVVVLMLFEALMTILVIAEDESATHWLVAGILGLTYVACMRVAFRPVAGAEHPTDD